jgi:hypothetical protein
MTKVLEDSLEELQAKGPPNGRQRIVLYGREKRGRHMTITKDQIIGALPNLSHEALAAIRAVIGTLLDQGPIDHPQAQQGPTAWLIEALAGVLGMAQVPPTMLQSRFGKQITKTGPVFLAFVEKHFATKLQRRVDAVAVMRSLIALIADDLKRRNTPVSYGTLVVNLHRVEEVFDTAFPSYISSGLAHMVIK